MLQVTLRQIGDAHHHRQVRRVEVRVPGRRTEHLCAQAKIALDEGRRLDHQRIVELPDRQCQAGRDPVLGGRHMRLADLAPNAGCSPSAQYPVVLHWNAGATDHGVAGVNIETIRYYQRRGLLDEPTKPPSGHRRYSAEATKRVAGAGLHVDRSWRLADIGCGLRVYGNTGAGRAQAVIDRAEDG